VMPAQPCGQGLSQNLNSPLELGEIAHLGISAPQLGVPQPVDMDVSCFRWETGDQRGQGT
jgi:hypothetical protein